MPGVRSTPTISALVQAAEALMSPLEWPSREAWMAESLRRVRTLFGAEASVMYGPLVAGRGVASPDLPPSIVSRLEAILCYPKGQVHSTDPAFDDAHAAHRRSVSRILTMRSLRAFLGPRLEESLVYQSVIAPSGLYGSASVGVMTDGCETVLSVMAPDEDAMELDADSLASMRLIRTAFVAGLDTYLRLEAWRTTLGTMLDRVDTGLAMFGRDGLREIARNARLDQLLREEPDRARLLELIVRAARQRASPIAARLDRHGVLHDHDQQLALAGGAYRLVSSSLAPGTLLRDSAILVLVDRVSPDLPSARDLVDRFDITSREAQVALLAAEGLSNKAIAAELGLSSHTVRHYLERVFDQLGLSSRKSLALFLLRSGAVRQRRFQYTGVGNQE